jgi:predicted permease
MNGVDWRVALNGALVTLAVTLPPVILVRILKGDDLEGQESNLWIVGVLAIFIGFAVGGFFAARRRPDLGLMHAAAAAGLAFAGVALYAVIRRAASGERVAASLVIQLFVVGTITVSIGVLGGYVATRRAGSAGSAGSAGARR